MKSLVLCLLAVVLTACSVAPQKAPPADPQAAFARLQARLADVSDWSMQARAAVRQGDEGGSVSLQWRQSPRDYQLDISGMLGAGRILIDGDTGGARLSRGDSYIESGSAEELLYDALGWSVPVPDLRLWVLGRPGLNAHYEIDEWGRLARLHAGEWEVEYQDYREVEGLVLPVRLTLARPDLRIRLAVSDWQLDGVDTPEAHPPESVDRPGPFSREFGR